MASIATGITHNHDDDDDAPIVRPRPRKTPALLQHKHAATESSIVHSDCSSPISENAPPSTKSLSSARKRLRAEQQQQHKEEKEQQQAVAAVAAAAATMTISHRRRLFPTTDFASRLSHFDPDSDHRDFHGFFNLFWIGLAIMGITTMLRHMKDTGYPFSFAIWSLFTVKLWHLAVADLLMVASTALSLPLHRRLFRPAADLYTWRRAGRLLQSLYQTVWLAVWVALPFWLEWTWTSQVFFLLHAMVLLMKMHSYAFYNGHLSETEKRLCRLDAPTARGTSERSPPYIYPVAAETRRSSKAGVAVDLQGGVASLHDYKSPPPPPPPHSNNHAAAGDDETQSLCPPPPSSSSVSAVAAAADSGNASDSDSEIEMLREMLARELTSPMGNVTYPANLTWANYLDFLLCPTLCYELEYPRTPRINWTSLVSKIIAIFGCIFLLTILSEEFILPVLVEAEARLSAISATAAAAAANTNTNTTTTGTLTETLLVLAETISWLLFPFMLTFLLVFLVIFEYVLGAMAEISRFADRHFYADWWNSTDWMAFSRQWNVPVHAFLRRHVYSASRPHAGRAGATALTFLISALGHEIVMACITKKLRGYGFVCQMLQLPIVVLQRTPWVRGRRTLNNVCFWCSMILGLSLICALYVLV